MRRAPVLASRRLAWALALAMLAPAASHASPEPEGAGQDPDEDARKAAAKAEVAAARTAFSAGEYQAAIDHYEAAMAILPAPKLHYNIGVCHQRLALAAETPEERTRQRDLAIDRYNRYLEQNPQAEDRLEVADTIRALGGTPVTMPTLKPLFGDEDGPSREGPEPGPEPASGPTPGEDPAAPAGDPPPATDTKPAPYPAHGRFGMSLVGGFSPTLRRAEAIDAPGLLALELHGGGFVGRKRRFLLAAHTLLYSGAAAQADGLSFYGYSLGLLGEQTWVLGHEAVQLGVGVIAGVTGQGLNTRDDVPPPLCSLDRGAQVASRSGGLFGPRLDLGLLLGSRRRGMISLLVQPSFAVLGDGPSGGDQCGAGETPWTTLGVRQRWQFMFWAGAGYAFRF